MDALGIFWVLSAAIAVLLPALVHGSALGPYNFLAQQGLTHQSGITVSNPFFGLDKIFAIIPWTTLAWGQVHQAHLPLWNQYSGLGMPLAFNWQSGAFSVPALIGYLFPLRLAYTVQVVVTLFIAGTGAFVFCRTLRLGVLAATFAATVFELSGPFITWLGWPHSAVISWIGWLFAAAVLIVKGRHRSLAITLFAFALACAIFAGQLEIITLLVLALAVFLLVYLALRAHDSGGLAAVRRPVLDLAIASLAGLALGAPLMLPGAQVIRASLRSVSTGPTPNLALPFSYLMNVITPGFTPLFNNLSPGAYLGVTTVVLALIGGFAGRHRPAVVALVATAIVMAGVVFLSPVTSLMDHIPAIGVVLWSRALLPMAFALAVLAGVGMNVLVHAYWRPIVLYVTGAGFALAGLVAVTAWAIDSDVVPVLFPSHAKQFAMIEALLGLVVVGSLLVIARRGTPKPQSPAGGQRLSPGQNAGLVLLCGVTVLLLITEAPVWSSSATFLPQTRSTLALEHAVGSSLVGFGPGASELAIRPNANVAYGIDTLAIYDPILPRAYFQSWDENTGSSAGYPSEYLFSPTVTTVAEARLFGVKFVIEPRAAPGPKGAVFDTSIAAVSLYRVPLSAMATVTPLLSNGALPANGAVGHPVRVSRPNPATWKLVTRSEGPTVLRLRLTNTPGWNATIDGEPLPLHPFASVMIQARIPPGRHTVELNYWPSTFTAGLILAACTTVGLVAAIVIGGRRRRSFRSRIHRDEVPLTS